MVGARLADAGERLVYGDERLPKTGETICVRRAGKAETISDSRKGRGLYEKGTDMDSFTEYLIFKLAILFAGIYLAWMLASSIFTGIVGAISGAANWVIWAWGEFLLLATAALPFVIGIGVAAVVVALVVRSKRASN
jgi:uncharacterized membrane protein (DUF2068 family)